MWSMLEMGVKDYWECSIICIGKWETRHHLSAFYDNTTQFLYATLEF
jgi:hypothetical protein